MNHTIDGLKIQQVLNKVGKYLYKHIDSSYKIQFSGNMCDVYIKVYYQLKYWDRIPGKGPEYNDVHEMPININLTTYQNKIRVNIIEADENERILTNPHPLHYLRINYTLRQFDEFIETYDIKPGDGMYLEPGQRILIW